MSFMVPPVYNFEILSFNGKYCQKFAHIFGMDKSLWCAQFNDWSFMDFRFGVEIETDFYLVSHQNWLRLLNLYGGGPEIPIY